MARSISLSSTSSDAESVPGLTPFRTAPAPKSQSKPKSNSIPESIAKSHSRRPSVSEGEGERGSGLGIIDRALSILYLNVHVSSDGTVLANRGRVKSTRLYGSTCRQSSHAFSVSADVHCNDNDHPPSPSPPPSSNPCDPGHGYGYGNGFQFRFSQDLMDEMQRYTNSISKYQSNPESKSKSESTLGSSRDQPFSPNLPFEDFAYLFQRLSNATIASLRNMHPPGESQYCPYDATKGSQDSHGEGQGQGQRHGHGHVVSVNSEQDSELINDALKTRPQWRGKRDREVIERLKRFAEMPLRYRFLNVRVYTPEPEPNPRSQSATVSDTDLELDSGGEDENAGGHRNGGARQEDTDEEFQPSSINGIPVAYTLSTEWASLSESAYDHYVKDRESGIDVSDHPGSYTPICLDDLSSLGSSMYSSAGLRTPPTQFCCELGDVSGISIADSSGSASLMLEEEPPDLV
ncbi:uncharacterized protein I303_103723 [Kwoniella dejecticola CBS 10117]|uniref:Uncharacterized protein n=1 Tax=Kwoniella dejecticola CBS 10117 TaxID=1296121 RepID=A0A1A6A7J1_9TREE|nr:uncharacterized protein I303_03740 [Kwoniella dejecticola CBS 10117]OBR86023.1 hypothetical protein I303_03740 [Kwoniella dejecticola CBS 10117]